MVEIILPKLRGMMPAEVGENIQPQPEPGRLGAKHHRQVMEQNEACIDTPF